MTPTVGVTKREGSIVGTVIAQVTDPRNEVRDVQFYIDVQGETGPYAPDVVRRPSLGAGVYERDVVLSAEHRTFVRVVAILDNGTVVHGNVVQDLGLRAASLSSAYLALSGGVMSGSLTLPYLAVQPQGGVEGGEIQLQGGGGHPTIYLDNYAGAVRFHDNAQDLLSVSASGIWHRNTPVSLQGHHHDERYIPLGAGTVDSYLSPNVARYDTASAQFAGRRSFLHNSSGWPQHNGGQIELLTNDASPVALGFHRAGHSAVTLRHTENGRLDLYDHEANWSQYRGGSFLAVGNRFLGRDGAYVEITNAAAAFLTSGSGGLQVRAGGLLVSDSYAHASLVPGGGIYARGTIHGAAAEAFRVNNAGSLAAYNAQGGVETFLWPRWIDNNTYFNFGGGGNFYLRDNASTVRLHISRDDAAFNTSIRVVGSGQPLRLGGPWDGTLSQVTSTPNLHLDCKDGWQTYINYHNDRAVNVGRIDQASYKLAVAGSIWASGGDVVADRACFVGGRAYQMFADGSYVGFFSGKGLRLAEYGSGTTFGYLRGEAGSASFGLADHGQNWRVRAHAGGVQMYGSVQDDHHNLLAASLAGRGNPTMGAREGSLYIQY